MQDKSGQGSSGRGERAPTGGSPQRTVSRWRSMRRTSRRLLIGLAAACAVIYVASAWAFGQSLGDQEIKAAVPPPAGLAITIVQTSITADEPYASALLVVDPATELVDGDGLLKETLQVAIEPSLNAESLTYPEGTIPSARTVTLPLRGRVQNYPFDTYKGEFTVQAYSVRFLTQPGSQDPTQQSVATRDKLVPVSVSASFRDPGWRLSANAVTSTPTSVTLAQEVSRAGSTIAISLLLLALMPCLAFIAVWAAQSAVSGIIEAQVSVAAWMAALLFALIPIRTFLPGSPPVGSWIDILVFFWVEVSVMMAMVIAVFTLLIRARREAEAEFRADEEAEQS